jgi:hypothetical protein
MQSTSRSGGRQEKRAIKPDLYTATGKMHAKVEEVDIELLGKLKRLKLKSRNRTVH